MTEIENVANKSCSPNFIFRKENCFQEGWVDISWYLASELWKCPIFDGSSPNRFITR